MNKHTINDEGARNLTPSESVKGLTASDHISKLSLTYTPAVNPKIDSGPMRHELLGFGHQHITKNHCLPAFIAEAPENGFKLKFHGLMVSADKTTPEKPFRIIGRQYQYTYKAYGFNIRLNCSYGLI